MEESGKSLGNFEVYLFRPNGFTDIIRANVSIFETGVIANELCAPVVGLFIKVSNFRQFEQCICLFR